MKKITLIFILALLFSGCTVNNNHAEINVPQVNIDNNSLNQILINSGVLNNNIYSADNHIAEIEAAQGIKFEIPNDYEIALDAEYSIKNLVTTTYRIKILRQIDKKFTDEDIEPWGDIDITSRMPKNPLIVAIVKDGNITNLFVINSFSVLGGSKGWGDYDKKKISKAIELKDLNNDGIFEILIYTFKGYTADFENGMATIYFNIKNKKFVPTDKIFSTTWKRAYEIVNINKIYYVIEAEPGSGSCRVCQTPYMVRINQFLGNAYFDIGSVGVEEEYEMGHDAINDALPRIKKKVLSDDVFPL